MGFCGEEPCQVECLGSEGTYGGFPKLGVPFWGGYIGEYIGFGNYRVQGFRVGGFPKLGVPSIMENQMEKKMENEMETGII